MMSVIFTPYCQKLTASTVKDGYVYSKDIDYIDADGLIYTFGRADDVINSGGNKISSR